MVDILKKFVVNKAAGVEREIVGTKETGADSPNGKGTMQLSKETFINDEGKTVYNITAPSTDAAKQWEGWGTALKPATEFWTLARKPISENTIAENVLKHGTGGINIDGSRIETDEIKINDSIKPDRKSTGIYGDFKETIRFNGSGTDNPQGRFPANVIFDEFTGKILDEQSGELTSGNMKSTYLQKESENNSMSGKNYERFMPDRKGDSGGASRFFYCPKADNFERNKGLKGFEKIQVKHIATTGFTNHVEDNPNYPRANIHPTVKPIDLMRYLVKLITPKHGICIDPFCGSGTTLIGCKLELIKYIGIDTNEEYCKISEARVAAWNPERYIEQTLF